MSQQTGSQNNSLEKTCDVTASSSTRLLPPARYYGMYKAEATTTTPMHQCNNIIKSTARANHPAYLCAVDTDLVT